MITALFTILLSLSTLASTEILGTWRTSENQLPMTLEITFGGDGKFQEVAIFGAPEGGSVEIEMIGSFEVVENVINYSSPKLASITSTSLEALKGFVADGLAGDCIESVTEDLVNTRIDMTSCEEHAFSQFPEYSYSFELDGDKLKMTRANSPGGLSLIYTRVK